MTPEERLLLNAETLLDTADRTFCGIALYHVTIVSQRYIERVVTWYAATGATIKESGLVYAFLLTLSVPELRRHARSFDAVEAAFDAWVVTLPHPIPLEELRRLDEIAARDTAQIEAAQVDVIEKPGAAPDPDAPGNS